MLASRHHSNGPNTGSNSRGGLIKKYQNVLQMFRLGPGLLKLFQNLMYVMHSENLLELYGEIGYDENPIFRDFKQQIRQLREVSRGNTRDYWQINWGDDDSRCQFNK